MPNEFWWADFIRRNDQDNDGPPLLFVTIRLEHRAVGRPGNLREVGDWGTIALPLTLQFRQPGPGAVSTEVIEKSQRKPNFSKKCQMYTRSDVQL